MAKVKKKYIINIFHLGSPSESSNKASDTRIKFDISSDLSVDFILAGKLNSGDAKDLDVG